MRGPARGRSQSPREWARRQMSSGHCCVSSARPAVLLGPCAVGQYGRFAQVRRSADSGHPTVAGCRTGRRDRSELRRRPWPGRRGLSNSVVSHSRCPCPPWLPPQRSGRANGREWRRTRHRCHHVPRVRGSHGSRSHHERCPSPSRQHTAAPRSPWPASDRGARRLRSGCYPRRRHKGRRSVPRNGRERCSCSPFLGRPARCSRL